MLKDKVNQLLDLIIGKVVDLLIAKAQAGDFDALLAAKVDEVVSEMTDSSVE